MLPVLLISLFPLAIYLIVLAGLNRQDRPVLVQGVMETLGLFFGLSGFLLVGLPRMLNHLYLADLLRVPADEDITDQFDAIWWKWTVFWGIYYFAMLAWTGVLLWLRRHARGIYNVDLVRVPPAVEETLGDLELVSQTRGNTLLLWPVSMVAAAEAPVELTFEVFAALCHVTLYWRGGTADFRQRFERILMGHLEDAASPDNPAASWFLSTAGLLFGVMFMLLAMWAMTMFLPRRGM